MTSTTSASPRLPDATARQDDRNGTAAAMSVSLPRLYLATLRVFYSCLVVLIVLAVIPWRYVITHYVTKPGDPWRSDRTRAVSDRP